MQIDSGSSTEPEKEKKEEQPGGEFNAMQQAAKAKEALTKDKGRIFEEGPLDPMFGIMMALQIENIENLICQPIIPTMIKAKLYDLLQALVQVNDP